jgi:hypothetical protein
VHEHKCAVIRRTYLRDAWIQPECRHVVHDSGSGLDGRRRYATLYGVYRYSGRRPSLVDRGDYGNRARNLVVGRDWSRSGARRLAANFDDVRTFRDHHGGAINGLG